MNFTKLWQTSVVLLLGLGITVSSGGCSNKSDSSSKSNSNKKKEKEHEHADEGPHDGHILELGKYHGEVVESDENESITIYILDGKLKELAVAAEKITANMTVNAEAKTFELKAADPTDGKASKFVGTKDFFEAVEHNPKAKVDVSITVDGTPNSASFTHDELGHDHEKHK